MSFLQAHIDKYWLNVLPCVFRVTYGGKYIIVKGKTVAGSLFLIQKGYGWFRESIVKPDTLYAHFYRHIKDNPRKRFSVSILLKTADTLALLKREQDELDKARFDQNCLNNAVESYIPKFNESTGLYGWLEKGSVLNFRKYLKSKTRRSQLRLYSRKQPPTPAKRGS